MSELTKNQLTGENNNSFPNNNTGYITPSLLRTFNQNMIDSLVDEVTYNADSASWTSDILALEQFSASLDANFVTPTELSASSSTLQNNINTKLSTSSFNAYTASQSAVATGSLLLTASAVGNVITFTKGDGSTFPVSIATGSVIDSSSLVTTSSFNQYTQSAASGVSASINAATSSLSASIAVTDLAQSSSIAALQLFSSSLDATFATDTQLSASASTLQDDINRRVLTSSFNTYTQSVAAQIIGIGQALGTKLNTSSLSVTQNITGSIIISGSSTGAGGETLRLLGGPNPLTDLALHVLSGSVEITTPQGNGAHFYSNAPITSSNLRINGTAVIKDLFVSGTWGGTGSGSLFVENSITASVISASTIIANSASFQYVQTVFETASIIFSSGSNQFGDEASDVQTLYGSVRVLNQLTASGLNYPTADNGEKAFLQTDGAGNLSLQYVETVYETIRNSEAVTINKGTPVYISGSTGDNGNAFIADASNVAKMPAIYIAGETLTAGQTGIAIVLGLIEGVNTTGYPAGTEIYVAEGGGWSASRPTGSASVVQKLGVVTKEGVGGQGVVINQLEAELPNLQTGYVWVGNNTNQPVAVSTASLATDTGAFLTTASFNAYTSSESSNVSASISASVSSLSASLTLTDNEKLTTSSFNTFTASYEVASGSFNTRITALETGSAPAGTVSSSIQIVELGFLETSSFNTYTQSNDTKVNDLIAKTGSFITTGSAGITQNITGSLVISGARFNAKVEESTLSIGVTNLDTLFESTQSGVTSQIDITRLGAGPTGDLTGVRLQTLSGSDTSGDTLLSRITTGVNRHTSTAMTGSVVNSTITATWATGSAGGRVSYSTTINANAQSASATLTLNAGNAAANYAGGTASIAAGRVNIGTTSATITSTGSFTHLGSLVTSQGITSNNGGITATSGSINGDLRVTGALTASIISASTTIQTQKFEVTASSTNLSTAANIRVPDYNTTGSYINNIGQNADTSVAGLLHIVNISSASMATLLSGSTTNPNTIYFVI